MTCPVMVPQRHLKRPVIKVMQEGVGGVARVENFNDATVTLWIKTGRYDFFERESDNYIHNFTFPNIYQSFMTNLNFTLCNR